jgi:hypothetical protein
MTGRLRDLIQRVRARWRIATISAVIGVLGALTTGSAAQAAKAPADFYGVAPQTGLSQADFERMGTAKVGVVRIIINWSTVDQTSSDGDNDWNTVDGLMLAAAQQGIELQPFIFGTPSWVAQGLDHYNCAGDKCVTFAPKSPEALAAYQKFVGEAVARYGPGGDFWTLNPQVPADPIKDWQAWNEMNSKTFFAPKPSAKNYVKLLKAFSVGVKAQDPSANVILGGMAQLAGSHKAIPGDEFLADIYDIKGASKLFDGVAIHPYGGSVNKIADATEGFTDVIKKAHDKKVGLWVTEFGAGSKKGGSSLNKGKKGQATLLTDAYKYFAKVRNKFNVQAVDWFSWQDSTTSICAWCPSSGLLTLSGGAKPSLKAFVKLTHGSTG